MFEAATALSTMFFQEILRLLDNYRHQLFISNVSHPRNTFRTGGFLGFHTPLRVPSLPPVVINNKGYTKIKQWANVISRALTNTSSMNARRITKYVTPEGTAWAPHSPGPGMAVEIHKTAAIAVFAAVYLPYSFVASLICSLASAGLRSGLPEQWQFSIYIGLVGWLPTLAFAAVYMAGRQRINQRRKQSWERWARHTERRIREFEGLQGPGRAIQERIFFDWVRDGEGDEGWFFEELQGYPRMHSDEESAIDLGIPGGQLRSRMFSAELEDSSSPSWTTSESTSDGSSDGVSSTAEVRLGYLSPAVIPQHTITELGSIMLELRSMESFDTAALSGDRALSRLPNIDSIALPVAEGSGTM